MTLATETQMYTEGKNFFSVKILCIQRFCGNKMFSR